jgi:hypothetical protein
MALKCILRSMLFLLLAAGTGCGAGKGDLTGSVKYKGKTVKIGTVTVFGSDGVPKSGVIDRDTGKFLVQDITAGEVKATVASPNPTEDIVVERSQNPKHPPPRKVDSEAMKLWFDIPARYSDIAKTDLCFTLQRAENQRDLELKD